MRELSIQQIYALSPQPKKRVDRMLETFQDQLVTKLHMAAASTIDEDGLVLREFLLEASRGVPTFPGERSGPELLQFRWSWSYSASELLANRACGHSRFRSCRDHYRLVALQDSLIGGLE